MKKGAVAVPHAITLTLNPAIHRQKRGISLEQIAEVTKISMRFLRAIEAGEYEKLPGGIYGTSYLRQYAAVTEFDDTALLTAYRSVVEPEPPEPEPQQSRNTRSLLDRWFGVPQPQRP